jgi:Protein of unknown function (DUF2491)
MTANRSAGARMSLPARALSVALVFTLLVPWASWQTPSWADSGGYSRPGAYRGGGASVRRPSVQGSGGYSLPSGSAASRYSGSRGAGDSAISRRNSAQSLRDYRSSIAPPRPSESARPPSGSSGTVWGGGRRPEPWAQSGSGSWWGQNRSYPRAPQGYPGGARQYGVWDAVMLWTLLNAVTSARSSNFFRENQNDPGYLQWRAEADRLAANDPAIAEKLTQLDRQLGQASETAPPTQPGSAAPATPSGDDSGVMLLVLVLGAAGLVGLWVMRRRAASGAAPAGPGALPGIAGSAEMRLRVGMTMPLDPSPFILAAGVTKVTPPAEGGVVSIEALGLVRDGASPRGGVALHRLYLPHRDSFFQLHLGASGQPDECRYFSLLDQIMPAGRDDWAFWLDPAQGMIGWPEFQTKDGKVYGRAWAPGTSRVPPRDQIETLRDVSGERSRTLHAMLYAGDTGAAPPAPGTEYILVQVIEQDDQAWVEVYAGIDINPAGLSLPSLPLS